MHDNAQFKSTYIALVALVWNALERIDQRLNHHHEAAIMAELPLLRLELLQLAEKARCRAGTRQLSTRQNVLVQRLVAKLLGWLDFDAAAPIEVARMRIWSAQNWLFEEARQFENTEMRDYEFRTRRPSPGPFDHSACTTQQWTGDLREA